MYYIGTSVWNLIIVAGRTECMNGMRNMNVVVITI